MGVATSGITVPGTAGSIVTVTTGTGDYLQLAQAMAAALAASDAAHTLTVSSVASGAAIPSFPTTKELIIAGGGGLSSVPNG